MREALVTVPTYVRSEEDLRIVERMLSSLRRFDPEVAVLVVDDGSPAAQLVDQLKGLTLRFNTDFEARPENSGFSATVNVGIRAALEAQKDAILANADLEFRAPFVDLMRGQQRLDGKGPAEVVGALLVYPDPRGLIQHAGQFMSLLTKTFGHRYQFAPEDLPEAQEAVVVPVTGALQLIRLEVLESLGPFDEAYRLGHEDVDYNVRVLADGGQCVMQPLIRAWHHESAFRGRENEKIARWHRESWAHFRAKWEGENFRRWIPSF